ncbi:uncharacterized protein LOC109704696 [Ananas comosus]|uniref:Uncharacterized protein LOC109704696 n=1 Tax=Ananas comosus TaxID=4615 RepID=A0A6P5ECE7_ANACO|nr:uncharacterized protein LOC109704696 [Ananas comosus]XP_020081049.1 uncharacterized protein LOC109704696 [Ananas comosus]XP_020081050.1 uncharacterized protein LOC109704696 [Ananas comosus]
MCRLFSNIDNLRAYLQIINDASILGLNHDIADHPFELFRDCSSAICLRNHSVEALATAALVQAIWEAQEPRTLGKLLDIYRKQKTLSSFDTKPEGLEEVPSITFSSTVTPLAFLAPEADEEALLEDIWKGKVTSSEENYSSNDQMKGVDDLGDKHMVKYLPASSKDPLQHKQDIRTISTLLLQFSGFKC